ncbi:MAG: hypothetical protein WD773_05020 [Gemmatimonadales bacterium]
MDSTQQGTFAVFTVCNVAYLPKALVLAEALLEHNNIRLKVFLVDRKVSLNVPDDCAEILWIEDANVPSLLELAFRYDITEFGTSVKPFLTLQLLKDVDKVIYLDPDTCLYSSLTPILEDLDQHSIILTPHYLTPQPNSLPDSDIALMRFGAVNLGFYAVRNTEEGIRFLSWLWDRCFRFCYFETQFGLSTDQKWVGIAPCFFPDLHMSFNVGYNVAFWNVHERTLTKDHSGKYLVNGQHPLVFFHFSSFDESNPELLSKRPFFAKPKKRSDLVEIGAGYKLRLDAKRALVTSVRYGFDYMSDGEYISPSLRRAYACVVNELPEGHDPFDSKGCVGAFARKNHLFERGTSAYVSNTYSDMPSHKTAFALVYFVMRMILRVLGPNRFANFSRLLVYLSSYRQNRELWKL